VHLILLSFRSFSTCTISSHCTKQKDSYIHESSLLQKPTTTLTKEEHAVRDSWILQKTYNPLWKCKLEWHLSCDNNFNWVNTFPGSTSKNNTQYCSLTIWDICPTTNVHTSFTPRIWLFPSRNWKLFQEKEIFWNPLTPEYFSDSRKPPKPELTGLESDTPKDRHSFRFLSYFLDFYDFTELRHSVLYHVEGLWPKMSK
jgi:hypothetical protein